jgi:hypothetical protein
MPSSVISDVRYDRWTASLDIAFVSGRVYRYRGVPADVVASFRSALSKGRFFNRHIRDNFRFTELEHESSADPWA